MSDTSADLVDVAEHPAKVLTSATASRDKLALSIFIFSPLITTSIDALVRARGEPNRSWAPLKLWVKRAGTSVLAGIAFRSYDRPGSRQEALSNLVHEQSRSAHMLPGRNQRLD